MWQTLSDMHKAYSPHKIAPNAVVLGEKVTQTQTSGGDIKVTVKMRAINR